MDLPDGKHHENIITHTILILGKYILHVAAVLRQQTTHTHDWS